MLRPTLYRRSAPRSRGHRGELEKAAARSKKDGRLHAQDVCSHGHRGEGEEGTAARTKERSGVGGWEEDTRGGVARGGEEEAKRRQKGLQSGKRVRPLILRQAQDERLGGCTRRTNGWEAARAGRTVGRRQAQDERLESDRRKAQRRYMGPVALRQAQGERLGGYRRKAQRRRTNAAARPKRPRRGRNSAAGWEGGKKTPEVGLLGEGKKRRSEGRTACNPANM